MGVPVKMLSSSGCAKECFLSYKKNLILGFSSKKMQMQGFFLQLERTLWVCMFYSKHWRLGDVGCRSSGAQVPGETFKIFQNLRLEELGVGLVVMAFFGAPSLRTLGLDCPR